MDHRPDPRRQAARATSGQARAAARRAITRPARVAIITELSIDETRELRASRSPKRLRSSRRAERHEMSRLMHRRALAAVRCARPRAEADRPAGTGHTTRKHGLPGPTVAAPAGA